MRSEIRNSDFVKEVVVRYHGGKEEIISDDYVIDQFPGILSFFSNDVKIEFINIKNMEDHYGTISK